jgi:tetratricopeptide (TPR) repeat protein
MDIKKTQMQNHFTFLLISAIFLQCFVHTNVWAQSRSFAGLPIMSPKTGVAYASNLNHLPEYSKLLNIYEKLVNAKGDRRMPVPQLNLRNEEAYVASMDYRLIEISIEKKAFDVANKYGDAAVAFLLAHELIHYYEKHGWRSQYADAVSDLETGKILENLNDRVVNEVQADVLGGFLAYSAGYGIFDKGGLLIQDLYKEYKMSDKIIGYPSKSDRIALSDRNKDQITKLSYMYEMAGMLTVIGRYKEAYSYYGFLLNKYQSRELYNNAGLTCMMMANSLLDPDSLIFNLPGVMDLEFSGSKSSYAFEDINKLANEALTHFETSIIMNKTYLPAYINKASTLIIKARNNAGNSTIQSMAFKMVNHVLNEQWEELKILHPELDFDKYQDELLILKAILAYYQQEKSNAKSLMTMAAEKGNETAKKNLATLNDSPWVQPASQVVSKISLDDMTAEKFLTSELVSRNQTMIDSLNIFRFMDRKSENYRFLTHEFKGNDQDIRYDLGFMVSKSSFSNTFMADLKLGCDKKEVINLLGSPKRSLSHINGEILNFNDSIIIITNQEGKVEKVVDFAETF